MRFTEKAKLTSLAIVHIFETSKPLGDYSSVAVLRDGAGFSVGINQFTHKSGSLEKVLNAYRKSGGSFQPEKLTELTEALHSKTPANIKKVSANKTYRTLLKNLGTDPLWQAAQREVMERFYLQPALDACEGSNFVTPMALAVIYDSKNQGSFEKIRDCVRFSRKNFKSDLEFEKAWITSYVQNRDSWLENFTSADKKKQATIRATDYRTDFFLAQIARNNWNLELPLNVHGHRLTADIFANMESVSTETPSVRIDETIQNSLPENSVELPPNVLTEEQLAENFAENSGGAVGGFIESAKTEAREKLNTAVEQRTNEAKSEAIDYVTQKLPNFSKTSRWLKGLSLTGFLGFIVSYLEGLPWYVLMLSGYVAGVASTALAVFLLYKTHYISVITKKVTDANTDPNQNNINLVQLPPTPGIFTKFFRWLFSREQCPDLSIR